MTSDSERVSRQHWTALCVVALMMLLAPPARANDDAETRAIARDLAVQGAEAFERGQYELALDRFDRAAALVHAPSIALMQARSLVAIGRWVEGLDKYHETARAQLEPDAPQAFYMARTDAAREAAELEARMPHLEIRVGDGQVVPDGVTIQLDGKEVPGVLLNVPRPIDPGEHDVSASDVAGRSASESIVVVEGEHKLVAVPTFEEEPAPAPEPPPIAAAPSPVATDQPEEPAKTSQLRDWAGPVAFAVGGIGAAGAAISGFAARDEQKRLDKACTPGCPPNESETLSSYRSQRTLFYVSLGVGLAGIAAGTYLTLTDDDAEQGIALSLTPVSGSLAGWF